MMSIADIIELVILCALIFSRWATGTPLAVPHSSYCKNNVY